MRESAESASDAWNQIAANVIDDSELPAL